jgi:hypothetical protein
MCDGFWADVAQLVEHSLGKGEVTSSILVIGSILGCERRVLSCEGFVEGRDFSRAARARNEAALAAEG